MHRLLMWLGHGKSGILAVNRLLSKPSQRRIPGLFPHLAPCSRSSYRNITTSMSKSLKKDSPIVPISQTISPDGRTVFRYYDGSLKPEPGSSETEMRLEFIEEPCGVPADAGFGYVQVEFGDSIGPDNRYEVLRKLGFGMYSSVWLAKDTKEDRFVAIKVLTGNATHLVEDGRISELDVLRHLSSQGKGMDETHCVSLHSHFIHPGKEPSDGEHLCLVMDVLGPTFEALGEDNMLDILRLKKILRDVLKALVYLHSLDIVHADLQHNNIMIDLGKGTFAFDIQAYINADPPRRHPPERTVGNKTTQVAVSQPFPVSQYKDWRSRSFVIGDFGSAQFIGKQVNDYITPVHLRAPEMILGLPCNEKVDIWAFGCMAFDFLSRQPLMQPFTDDCEETSVLYMMLSLTNERLPAETIRSSKRAMEYLNPETGWLHDVPSPLKKSLSEAVRDISTPENASALAGFEVLLSKCLRIDPKDRPSARELLEDPWLNSDY